MAQQFSVHNDLHFNIEDNFKEMYFGELDGISFDEIRDSKYSEKRWHQLEQFWHSPSEYPLPEAESLLTFYQRISTTWETLLKQYQGNNVLLVCHGGVIRIILSLLLKIKPSNQTLFNQLTIKNSSITLIKNLAEQHIEPMNNSHNNVLCISTPLKCIAQYPEEF